MSKGRKKQKKAKTPALGRQRSSPAPPARKAKEPGRQELYERACRLAEGGNHKSARALYKKLQKSAAQVPLKALLCNDLAALAAFAGDIKAARKGFRNALAIDAKCEPARANLLVLEQDEAQGDKTGVPVAELAKVPANASTRTFASSARDNGAPVKVAILSFLFNWPSTGGGIIHTVELAQFLAKAGFQVRHFYAVFPPWGIGGVQGQPPLASEALRFDDKTWNLPAIQTRFRQAVDAFGPDHVIISDSWNMKPLLAEAVRAHPFILRLQALECLCPLNNVRLLPLESGGFRQCPVHQLANPQECSACVQKW